MNTRAGYETLPDYRLEPPDWPEEEEGEEECVGQDESDARYENERDLRLERAEELRRGL